MIITPIYNPIPPLENLKILTNDGKDMSWARLYDLIAGTANRITVADDGDGTITFSAPQDIHTGATPTFASLTLGANPSVISSANVIQIKPSGDTDDYLEFSTSSDIPRIGIKGGNNLYIVGDVSGAGIRLVSSTNYSQIKYISGSDTFQILSSGDIHLRTGDGTTDYLYIQTCGDTDDYIYMATANHVPTIGTIGACDLKITSSSGEIDFDNENLSTTGDIAALTLSSDTFRSADESMSVAWGSTAAGYLVLDGTGDYVNATAAKADVNTTTGAMAIWGKLPTAVLTDSSTRVAFTVGDGATNSDVISIRKSNTNRLNVRYRVGAVNYEVDTANVTGYDSWKLYVLTWDATYVYLYVDNALVGSTNRSAGGNINAANFTNFCIGTVYTNTTEWIGELSDAMLFNATLDLTAVQALFALGRNPTTTQVAGLGSYGNLQSWWPFTADAADAEGSRDGTFVGNAYINSTLVIGLNTNYPLLVNGAFTVVGAANVTGNLTVSGEISTTKVVGQGSLYLESSSRGTGNEHVKSETIMDQTTASAANVEISSDVIQRSTSASMDGLWKEHIALIEAGSDKFMQLKPSIYKSKHKNDDPNKLRFGLYAEDVAEIYPSVAVWHDNRIENYDTRELIALMVAEIQDQEKRIRALETTR